MRHGFTRKPGFRHDITARSLAAFATALLLGAGCDDWDERAARYDAPLQQVGAPIALDGHLAFVDGGLHRVLLLDIRGESPGGKQRFVDLPHGPVLAERRAGDHDELLVLSSGRRATREEEAVDAALTRISAGGKATEYGLTTNPFDRLAQSPDGRFALLMREHQGEHLLENTNVIAVVDLEADTEDAVHFHTLDFRPTGVVYSPKVRIGGEQRSLAVATADSSVAVLDLDHPERRVSTISLSIDANRVVRPAQVLFDSERARIYLRPDSTTDVFALRLTPREVEAGRNDFATAIDILATDGFPLDMALYGEGDAQRLLILAQDAGRGTVSIVDPSTSRSTGIALPQLADRIALFRSGPQAERRDHALLWQQEGAALTVLDLLGAEELGERNLEALPSLGTAVTKVLPLSDDTRRLLLVHSSPGMSLLNLETRSVAPFAASTRFDDATFDIERGRVWVAPPGQPRVGFVQVDGGATGEVLLDAPVQQVVPALAQDRLVVVHPGSAGHLTLVDVTDPQRDALHRLEGFLLHGLLD